MIPSVKSSGKKSAVGSDKREERRMWANGIDPWYLSEHLSTVEMMPTRTGIGPMDEPLEFRGAYWKSGPPASRPLHNITLSETVDYILC